MYILVDKAMFEGTISFDETKYTLDYDDPEEEVGGVNDSEVAEFNKRARKILEPYAEEFRRVNDDLWANGCL